MTTLQVLPQPSPFGAGSVPSAALVGPLDLVSGAVFAVGHRALTVGWLGLPLYTLRRDSDDTEQAFVADVTSGEPPTAAITTFNGGGGGWMHIWNDQAGGGFDIYQEETAIQPQWIASVLNSKPGFRSTTSGNPPLSAFGIDFPNGGATIFMVANADAEVQFLNLTGSTFDVYTGATGGHLAYLDLNDLGNADAEVNYPVLTSAIKIIDGVVDFTTHSFRVNGVAAVLDSDGTSGVGPVGPILNTKATVRVHVGADAGTVTSSLIEVIAYASVLTDAERLLVRQNIAAYYGVTLP